MGKEDDSQVDKDVNISYSTQDMKTIMYFLMRNGVAVAWDKDMNRLERRRQELQAQYQKENFEIFRLKE